MQRYLEQLIEDIHQATWKIRPPHELWAESQADPDDELELEDMSYSEKYVEGEKLPISTITGIEASALPPAGKLTAEQQHQISIELEKLLEVFHFQLEFPENYPAHLRYPFIREFWKENHVAMSFGTSHIEFCELEKDKCPFPGYCKTCDEIEEQMKADEKHLGETHHDFAFNPKDLLPTNEELEKWAKEQNIDIHNSNQPPAINGLFNDDGTPINTVAVPVPGLCIICQKHQSDNCEENWLCILNRNDQRDDSDFECGAYEKI